MLAKTRQNDVSICMWGYFVGREKSYLTPCLISLSDCRCCFACPGTRCGGRWVPIGKWGQAREHMG